jgi:N-methylhydantoinase B
MQLRADRMKFRPYGLAGGDPGSIAHNVLEQGGTVRELPSKTTAWLKEGDLVVHDQPGGGGFGDPLDRDPALVARDVWNGKVSAEYARDRHRVVVDPLSGTLDTEATAKLRAQPRTAAA